MIHPTRRLAFAAVTLGLAACSGGAATKATTSSPAAASPPDSQSAVTTGPASSATAAAVGPATAVFMIKGDQGLAGQMAISGIHCNQPSLDGPVIAMFGQPANKDLSMLITLSPAAISVRLNSGSGATYVQRDFHGAGVTGFDAAVGAKIDSPLTPQAGEAVPAGLGVIGSIVGIVDCGNQKPGSSTITLTDPTSGGGYAQPLSPVRVECDTNAQGESVQLMGLAQIGSTTNFVIVTIRADGLTVAESGRSGLTHFYTASGAGLATLSAGGAHADGDLTQQFPSVSTPNVVHMTGDATCGTTLRSN
jgi:hypothetical protein